MAEMRNPNDPAKKKGGLYNPRTTLPFLVVVTFLYLLMGLVTGNWTNGMSEQRREMFYISIPIVAAYFIWTGIRSLFHSRNSKSD
jgi:hypothetical protein